MLYKKSITTYDETFVKKSSDKQLSKYIYSAPKLYRPRYHYLAVTGPVSDYYIWPSAPPAHYSHWYPTYRLHRYFIEPTPARRALRSLQRMIYAPISSIDYSYSYYPETTKYYRPLTMLYNYYWPLRTLNYYSDTWPTYSYWPTYRYYKYLRYPSDRYWFLQRIINYVRNPITTGLKEYSIFPSESKMITNRFKLHKPLHLYYNFYFPIRSLNQYSSFLEDIPVDRAVRLQRIFDDETRLIRAQTASLLKRIHSPIPRIQKTWPITTIRYDDGLPARLSNDNYIHRLLTSSPSKAAYTTYYSEPVRKYIGQGHLSCVSYAGDRSYNRRRNVWIYEDPLRSDIQLLSYYIQKFRQEKASQPKEVPLSASRPSRRFNVQKLSEDTTAQELKELKEARAARLANIYAKDESQKSRDVDDALKAKKKQEEARLAEEKALAEEQARLETQAKKDEAARKVELARQEELAAQAAAERAAELEKQAELAKQQELAKQAEIEKARKQEEERLRQEEQKRIEEEARAEEERKQLLRLEELARQAEEEKEAELARQADELAELARQEAELAEQAKKEAEEAELLRQQAELEELERQEAELLELERKEKELAEQAKVEAEAAERARLEAEVARKEAELAELAQQEAELAELDRQQAELEALDAEAKALEEETPEEVEEPEPAAEEEEAPEEVVEESAAVEETVEEEEEEPHAISEDAPGVVESEDEEVEE